MQIQLAIDLLDFDATLNLAEKTAESIDIIELGTPCLKVNGLALVIEMRKRFPGKLILADLKTMDAGEYEAEPFYAAGADICTVLGAADIGTIKGVVAAARKYGKRAQVDLINVADKAAVARLAVAAGVDIIGVHTGLDQQAAGQTPFTDIALISSLGLPAIISVAGGIKAATIVQALQAGASIIVAGGAIYGAAQPELAAAELRRLGLQYVG